MAEKYDPGYLPSLARSVISEWYGITSFDDLLALRAETLNANQHVAYNQFRLVFVARAAFGAGLIDETTSWQLTTQHLVVLQRHYGGWREYGNGYIEGHLAYRALEGDDASALASQRVELGEVLRRNESAAWAAVPWATRLS